MNGPHYGDNFNNYGGINTNIKNVGQPDRSGMPDREMSNQPRTGVAWKAPLVFINYRSTEERAAAYLEAALSHRLGPGAVFRDAAMPAGTEFPRQLLDNARNCRLMLAIIGEKWDHRDHGLRLLRDPNDWVRIEIGAALAHGVTVVPIMVGVRGRLVAGDLPPDVRQLAYLQGRHLRHGYDVEDARRLVAELL